MEAFSLLKYWRGGGHVSGGGDSGTNTRPTTIVTALAHNTVDTDDDDDDDGPFFDLEFAVPEEGDGEDRQERKESSGSDSEEENGDVECSDDGDVTDEEREFNFTLSSCSSNDRADPNLALSPSDDLFFKGRLVPIESTSLVLNGSEPNSKHQFPASLLKSATKFRVFMLGFKKLKMNAAEKISVKAETNGTGSVASATPKQHQKQGEKEEENKPNKLFTVKFKVEEVPIVSLFSRENSKSIKSQKQNSEESAASDDKRFTKDVMQKYLKKVKPLYIRVSKRYGEKLRFSGQLSLGSVTKSASPPPSASVAKSSPVRSAPPEKSQPDSESAEAPVNNAKNQKQGNLSAGLRVVCKHLGKSRSASSAVAAAPPAPALSKRRDDSLLQQQDGIQSAILHCKRSFNASRDSDTSVLSRSVSDPSHHDKSTEISSKKSSDEGKGEPKRAVSD